MSRSCLQQIAGLIILDMVGGDEMRATVTENAFAYRTVLDGVVVRLGGLNICQTLADELNASDEKCDALLRAFA